MPGWRDEADAEDIDGHAQHVVNNEGQRTYHDAYRAAKDMKEKGHTPEQINEAVIHVPAEPWPGINGSVAMIHRKAHAAKKQLAAIQERAVEDALGNRPPRYDR